MAFPLTGTDSFVFLPAALNLAAGRGFTNPLYYVVQFTDPSGSNLFNYYVPLFPLVLGTIAKLLPDIRTIFFICALVSATTLLIYRKLLLELLPKNISTSYKIAAVLSFTYLCTYMLPTVGRPENFIVLFSVLLYWLYQRRAQAGEKLYTILTSLLLGAMLATQLISFFLGFIVLYLYDNISAKQPVRVFFQYCIIFISSLIIFAGILSISPVGLMGSINGISTHAQYVLTRIDNTLSSFSFFWLLAPLNLGFGVLFGIAAYFFVIEMKNTLTKLKGFRLVMLVISLLSLFFGVYKYVFYGGPTVYNATCFVLPILLYIFSSSLSSSWKYRLLPIVTLTFVAGSLLLIRTLLLFGHTVASGKDYAHAKAEAKKYMSKTGKTRPTNGIWSLYSNPNEISILDGNLIKTGDTVIIQQAYMPFPLADGTYTILADWRAKEPIQLLGIPLAKRAYGFGFVVCVINKGKVD